MADSVLIGMSGGVDSSVAVFLLKSAGYDCLGATLKLYDKNDPYYKNSSFVGSGISSAQSVADALQIPFHLLEHRCDFKSSVIDRFVFEYERGNTPNPCIICNKTVKFPLLFKKADELNIDLVATGHYARIGYNAENGRYFIKKAKDLAKDQSYVLYSLSQDMLKRLVLPLGEYTKEEIRAIAAQNRFENAYKSDSQDICFVPDGDYYKFITEYTGKTYPAGDFTDKDGNVLGRHKGIIGYTVGQRRGLGLALKSPMYVCEKDHKNNRVILCENDRLFSNELVATDFNWMSTECPSAPVRLKARIRYNQAEQNATVYPLSNGNVRIEFDEPQRAISKGQSVVLYDGDAVAGGGVII